MSDLHGRIARLVDELKRRGVLRVAAVYLVAAWAAIQVADVTFPRLGFQDWTVTFVIALLAALFPVVVGLSWAFDLKRADAGRTDAGHAADAAPVDGQPFPVGAQPVPVPAGVATTERDGRRTRVLAATLLALPLVAFGLWYVRGDARAAALDRQLVAVMPFRVAGAAQDLGYMREGLLDLLAARVGGVDGELRVVAPRTMSRRLRDALGSIDADPTTDAALDLAFDLGAGRLLQGVVVGRGDAVIVTATLYDVVDGRELDSKTLPPMPADSLHALVDAIATQLIAAESGLRRERLESITTRSVPALRAFIDAEHAFRRGRHQQAVSSYDQAVQLDSTFALAALGLLRARGWALATESVTTWDQARRAVRNGLHQLGEADRAFYEVFAREESDTHRDRIDKALRAAQAHPDQADLQYLAGDIMLHIGTFIGIDDALERGRRQLERVVEMDTAYGEPLIHLFELAVARDDTAGKRRYGDLLMAIDSTGPFATKVRYIRDGDAGTPTLLLDTLSAEQLNPLMHPGWGQAPRTDARAAYLRLWERARVPEDVRTAAMRIELLAMRGGQPSLLDEIERRVGTQDFTDAERVIRAIYWLRDPDAARSAVAAVEDRAVQLATRTDPDAAGQARMHECTLGHYAIATGDAARAESIAAALDADTSAAEGWRTEVEMCSRYLRAGVAVLTGDADAMRIVTRYDDYVRAGPSVNDYIVMVYALGLAHLWEELGEPERALAVVRRRLFVPEAAFWSNELNGERARLADQLGHREEAIVAYREYLSHFHEPEPPFDARVAHARTRLAALAGEGRR